MAIPIQKDVVWFEISMNISQLMYRRDRQYELSNVMSNMKNMKKIHQNNIIEPKLSIMPRYLVAASLKVSSFINNPMRSPPGKNSITM
jgi:hypothetical protein